MIGPPICYYLQINDLENLIKNPLFPFPTPLFFFLEEIFLQFQTLIDGLLFCCQKVFLSMCF